MTLLVMAIGLRASNLTYNTSKTGQAILIDGKLNEEAWSNAEWGGNFQMHYPYDNKIASEKTEFAVLHDNDFLYVAIKSYDSQPDKIVNRLTRRDDLDGDWVAIQFDSYHDLQTAYEFQVSVAGTKSDNFFSNDGDDQDGSWDPIWWVKTSRTDYGWVAEMKIPLSQFRFVSKEEQVWGLQLERFLFREDEKSIWAPTKRDAPGWVHHFGEMHGLNGIQPKKVFDLTPYTVGSFDSYKAEDGNPFQDGSDFNGSVGLDGKVGITNNLTLDFTINPDFGQVEADPSTVNLSGFEQFFSERRPFFVEGSNIIDFPFFFGGGDLGDENLFYSRRIGRNPHHYPDLGDNEYAKVPNFTRIIGAAKVTGRTEGGLNIGISESVTANEKALIQNEAGEQRKESVEPMTNYTVARVQQDFGEGNTLLGGMVTSTNRINKEAHLNYIHDNAYSAGIDLMHQWKDKTWFAEAKTGFSYVEGDKVALLETQESPTHNFQRPDATHVSLDSNRTSLSGNSSSIAFGKQGGGRFRFVASTYLKTPGFETNDIGYVRQVDDIITLLWGGYQITEPFSIFRSLNFNMDHWTGSDFGGAFNGQGLSSNVFMNFKNNYGLGIGVNIEGEQTATKHLRGGPAYVLPGGVSQWVWIGSDDRKKVHVSGHYSHFRVLDQAGGRHGFNVNFRVNPTKRIEFKIQPSYSIRTYDQQYVAELDYNNDKRYVLARISQETMSMSLRLNINITPDLSIQYWGQPFVGTGKYTEYKRVTDARNETYESRFETFSDEQTIHYIDADDNEMVGIDETGDGAIDYSFDQPNFNSKIFLSNAVLRWEYMPGSTLFLVWSQNRENFDGYPDFNFNQNVEQMFNFKPHDTFLIKLSYRIGV